MDDETLTLLRYYFQRIIVPTIVVIGLLGNFVTVIVLTRRRMRCSTNVYLFFLAAVDMVFLLFNFILSLAHYPHLKRAKYELYWRLFGIFVWLTDGSSYSSIYLTVSFTVERYIAVCHPIRGQALCTESRAKKVIAVVIILCFLLTGTTSFEYMLNSYERFEDVLTGLPCDPSANIANLTRSEFEESLRDILRTQNKTEVKSQCVKELYLEAVPSALGSNETYLTIVTYTSAVLFTFLPLILLTTFNCFLIAAVHNSTRIRRNMTNSRKSQAASIQENKMTVTLIAVVVLFLVCQTPTAIFMLYKSFVGDPTERRQRNLRLAIGNILNCLVIINASCNFILYCALSAKYRQTVKDILFRRGRLKRQNTTHTRLSRCVSRATDENGRSWRGGGGNSRTPSFQADARQKLNSYSRTPSFTLNNNNNARRHSGRFGLGDNVAVAAAEGPASGDRNRTSSISEKHQSINASDIGNYLTDDVNRKYSTSSNTRLAVPQSSRRGSEAAADGTTAAPSVQKKDSLKMTEHLLRSSQSSASLTRSQSLMFPEQPKHSPTCKAHPLNK